MRAAAAAATRRRFRAGEAALVEDGEPADGLYIVEQGAMELVHADRVVDVLEPGECFGQLSLLTGMAPAFTVRAREDTGCLLVPREEALRVLGQPDGAGYVARSLRERLVKTGRTVHALPELSLARVGELVDCPPLVLGLDTPLRDAARAMTDEGVTAALVHTPEGPALVTDADLRERALAAGLAGDEPLRVAVGEPALCIPADRTAGEALVDLLDGHRRELCVVDARRVVVGVLSVEQLAAGEHSPFALRQTLSRAPDVDALVEAATAGLPRLLGSLLSGGLAPIAVSRALAAQSDAATQRLLELALERHGPAPAAWAWLGLGSVARRELTLGSDQDNALAYAGGEDPGADAALARVAAEVNAGLARCGFGADHAEVLARNPAWRMSAERWRAVFRECLERPDRSHLVRAAVSFDFRAVAGGLEVTPPLVAVLREARHHQDFLRRLARTATDVRLPLGWRARLVTDRDGRVDLKRGAAVPIANLARLHALAGGITISATVDRLVAAQETGQLERETATALREAFGEVHRIRLEHHAACLRAGRTADNRVDPGALPPLRRAGLREALRAVAAAQKQLGVYAPRGI
ncbi:MAG: DUF294 nucleotidyltransferase-like domain-containing protein [Actinomycetota bacterium]|nr:DUF294 nucleotidyltransferase-like domain-containing protein [Actinomycetota bacterium]